MLAIAAAIVFALALLLDLVDYSSDAFNTHTLMTLGLLFVALQMAGIGGSANVRGRNWSRGRPRSRARR